MYCTKCGTENKDNAKFCYKCSSLLSTETQGEPIAEEVLDDEDYDNLNYAKSIIDQVDEERKNVKPKDPINPPEDKATLLKELERLHQYFSKINLTYKQLVDSGRRLSSLRKPSLIRWIFGGLFIAFVVYFGLVLVKIDLMAGFFVLWALITVCGFILSNNKYKKDKHLFEHNVISTNYEITVYYNEAIDCCIAYEYSDPSYVEEIIKILKTGRADTLGNAINIMLDDIHKGKVLQQQIIMNQQARQANRAAVTNALMLAAILRKK